MPSLLKQFIASLLPSLPSPFDSNKHICIYKNITIKSIQARE